MRREHISQKRHRRRRHSRHRAATLQRPSNLPPTCLDRCYSGMFCIRATLKKSVPAIQQLSFSLPFVHALLHYIHYHLEILSSLYVVYSALSILFWVAMCFTTILCRIQSEDACTARCIPPSLDTLAYLLAAFGAFILFANGINNKIPALTYTAYTLFVLSTYIISGTTCFSSRESRTNNPKSKRAKKTLAMMYFFTGLMVTLLTLSSALLNHIISPSLALTFNTTELSISFLGFIIAIIVDCCCPIEANEYSPLPDKSPQYRPTLANITEENTHTSSNTELISSPNHRSE